jgi:hypothetical protein
MGRFPLLYARDAACYIDYSEKRRMTENNITPPPELVQQWVDTYFGGKISQSNFHVDLATRAAQWGADCELDACCEWFQSFYKLESWMPRDLERLRATRRPKPPSLKGQALDVLERFNSGEMVAADKMVDTIRRALEQLPE